MANAAQQVRSDSYEPKTSNKGNNSVGMSLHDDLNSLKGLHNRKSEQLLAQSNAKQSINIQIKKDLNGKQSTSANK